MRLRALRVRGSFVGLSVFPAHHAVSLKPEAIEAHSETYIYIYIGSVTKLGSQCPPFPFKQEEYLEEIIESTYALVSVSRRVRKEAEKDVLNKSTSW